MKKIVSLIFLCISTLLYSMEEQDKIIQKQPHIPFLYAPWRNSYDTETTEKKDEERSEQNCPFCAKLNAHNDEKYFILKRGKHCTIALNIFPYTTAHLLIITNFHKPYLNDLSPEARFELIEFTNQAFAALQEVYKTPGANVGFNMGKYSGASIPEHLHMHIVPRTYNHVDFMNIIGYTPVIYVELRTVYNKLKDFFKNEPNTIKSNN